MLAVRYLAKIEGRFRISLSAPEMETFRNKHGRLTVEARRMHALVRKTIVLENDADPDVQFSMSSQMRADYEFMQKDLIYQLRLPKKHRTERIRKMRDELLREGIPYWVQDPR